MSNLNADIDAYRRMIAEAKAARLVDGVESPKGDALYEAVIVQGNTAPLLALAGARSTVNTEALAKLSTHHARTSAATPAAARPAVRLASDRQIAFATKLLAERETAHAARLQAEVNSGELSIKRASELIDWLLQAPRIVATVAVVIPVAPAPSVPAVTITDGFYELDGTAYKVQLNQSGTRLYGKKLVDGSWEFVQGIVGVLTRGGAVALTEELAASLGQLYGACVICGRRLTDEVSIARGIGPVCLTKQGW